MALAELAGPASQKIVAAALQGASSLIKRAPPSAEHKLEPPLLASVLGLLAKPLPGKIQGCQTSKISRYYMFWNLCICAYLQKSCCAVYCCKHFKPVRISVLP